MHSGWRRAGWALAALLAAVACGPDADAPAPASSRADADAALDADLDRLRALGYVGYTDERVDPDAERVTDYDPVRSAPGYNLISNRDLCSAQLLDAQGRVVHEWRDAGSQHWSNAELLPDGSLLVSGSRRSGSARERNFLLRLSWDGRILWRRPLEAHHDAELTSAGAIATLVHAFRRLPAIDADVDVKDSHIAILDAEGRLREDASLYDLLASAPERFRFQRVARMEEGKRFVDLLHPSSLEFAPHAELAARHPIYAPTSVLVSIRHQDTIAIFDWPARELIWAWGQGELSGPHDATYLPNGNLLVFDNGMESGRSRIVELDPLAREIVWQYQADPPEAFFSLRKGSAQRLANGNTLVANSDSGEAFEVTPGGDVVWRLRNPNASPDGRRATIVRIKRYPKDLVEAWLRS